MEEVKNISSIEEMITKEARGECTEKDVRTEMLSQWMAHKTDGMKIVSEAMDLMLEASKQGNIGAMIDAFTMLHDAHMSIERSNIYIMYNAYKVGMDLASFLPCNQDDKDQ